MIQYDPRFLPFQRRMQKAGLPDLFVATFAFYYHQLIHGHTGLVPEKKIEPLESVTHLPDLPDRLQEVGKKAKEQTALIKLNGGLGTSMGLQKAKSLLVVKDDATFLDIISQQCIRAGVPLVLMNSFVTEEDSLKALAKYPELRNDLPQTFVQHMEPKVRQSDFLPVDWPQDPELEWCPPGHGDIYTALVTRGVLEQLLQAGYKFAFISNADNLGATLNLTLLGHFAESRLPFMLEVAKRTEADRKGGHLARRRQDDRLILRELAQCPPEETDSFQDISRYSFFNTNNLWINLESLGQTLSELDYKLQLPMIRNNKTVDPRDKNSTPVYQLETAMGSAIEVFAGAEAIVVPRSRFAPVKKTNDLLLVRSDVYQIKDDYSITMHPDRNGHSPLVDLDQRYYQFVAEFDERFSHGVPSMLKCNKFTLRGDFAFGAGVSIQGDTILENYSDRQQFIPDGAVLTGRINYP